ncbi:hypothetical protein CROQUDRAFT_654758 [Cronartium quercuum f. sp. fusiforme G11]|uniref:Glutathione S-transferase n=1 Tax=Cronartium quercuum f. sp. fusiforme G11 TaxID=708437 RepID=A0A9P6NM07_9BASI|nr:hypothetical protein CROQUDRAFT_654758 [Cronartium quercuum f. sp. fusiforme G11]
MAPTLKLHYFDMKGRAEAIRLACTIGNIEFEDVRFSQDEFKSKVKSTTPFGQVPVMEIDGKIVSQGTPLLRYVAKLANNGLYPVDAFEALKVDEYLNVLEDIQTLLRPSFFEADSEKKIAIRKALVGPEGQIADLLHKFEKAISESGSKGYSVGSKLTISDLAIYCQIEWFTSGILDGFSTNMYDAYPRLKAIHDTVVAHPKVAEWVKAQFK